MTKEAPEALVLEHVASEHRHELDDTLNRQPVCERVHFGTATVLARLVPAPSVPLPA
ncbi:hypothetical protein [Streptomyces sp. NPDC005408]|uniref:hypothetical protein n=1 Tax=Streptomyces sp. NPDC005408 TaxID=3155341 RepID=UPI0033A7E92A